MTALEPPPAPATRAAPMTKKNPHLPAPLNNVYALRVVGSIENQMTVSTFYYRDNVIVGSAVPGNIKDVAEAFQALGAPYLLYVDACSIDWTAQYLLVDCPTSPALAAQQFTLTDKGAGPLGHEPTTVAATILKTTQWKGQCGRGRMSIPAVPSTWIDLSSITNMAAYNALASNMSKQITGPTVTYVPVLWSRAGSFADPGQGCADLLACTATKVLGTCRRRKLGRGA